MVRSLRGAATALLALALVSAALSPAAASRALLLATDDALGAQEITRENADMIDIICGFPDGVSSRTIQQTMMTNLTNGIFKGQLAREYDAYRWAEPQLDDMEWLCNMMRDFNNEREVAFENGKDFELLFYGDSILQCMRFHSDSCDGAIDVYDKEYGNKYRSAVWALGGETTQSLMWRVMHGNAPDPKAKAVVLNIGSQDLMSSPQDPETWELAMDDISTRIKGISDFLKNNTEEAQILLTGLLPLAGYDSKGKPTDQMSNLYREGIDRINQQLREYGLAEKRVSYIDCIDKFTEKDDPLNINTAYFNPVGNVPTDKGFEKFAECIRPFIEEYIGKPEEDTEQQEEEQDSSNGGEEENSSSGEDADESSSNDESN